MTRALTTTPVTATLPRSVTVAAGVFAPGHLGELTRYLPFELVDDVLARTHTLQKRLRLLPSRTGVYFVLALGLFPGLGYARVWAKLCGGLAGITDLGEVSAPMVSEKALRDLRRRLGPAPLKLLFDIVSGPLAQPRTPGCQCGPRLDSSCGRGVDRSAGSRRNPNRTGRQSGTGRRSGPGPGRCFRCLLQKPRKPQKAGPDRFRGFHGFRGSTRGRRCRSPASRREGRPAPVGLSFPRRGAGEPL